jgi:hypothetical protein
MTGDLADWNVMSKRGDRITAGAAPTPGDRAARTEEVA